MNDDLIEDIRDHVMASEWKQSAPATEAVVEGIEHQLGFKIPDLLRSLYLTIGDGGFGPGCGIIKLGAVDFPDENFVQTYEAVKASAEGRGLPWKNGMLPFCEWGCNVFSCVDCTETGNAVFTREDDCKARPAGYNLDQFFTMWLQGVLVFPGRKPTRRPDIVNPFLEHGLG